MADDITITPLQREKFLAALLSAFPRHEDLERMLELKLGWQLATITPPGGLQTVVLALLRHAQAQGQLQALLEAARAANPGNPRLRDFDYEVIGPPPGIGAPGVPTASTPASGARPLKVVYT